MSNKAIYIRELPTPNFIMREINEQKASTGTTENQRIGKLFYLLAALQIFTILVGAVLALLIAPGSLFASRTQEDEVFAITVGLIGVAAVALGLIIILLSLAAAVAFRRDKNWRNVVGFAAAGLAILTFPFGTILGGYLVWKIINRKKGEEFKRTTN